MSGLGYNLFRERVVAAKLLETWNAHISKLLGSLTRSTSVDRTLRKGWILRTESSSFLFLKLPKGALMVLPAHTSLVAIKLYRLFG